MPSPESDRQRRPLLRHAIDRLVADLGRADAGARVPGLTWSVAQLGAHLVVLPRLYREMATGSEPMPLPPDLHVFSGSRVAAVETRDLTELGSLIRTELHDLLVFYGDDPDARFHHWVTDQPLGVIESALLSELLIHGRDLAAALGETRTITRDEALVCLEGLLPVAANFVDPREAADVPGVFHLHLRSGETLPAADWTQTIADGAMTVDRGRPDRADVRLNAHPVSLLLTSVGRIGQVAPALTGKIVVYGRKPWLAVKLAGVYFDV